jgi:hypothetical protein
VQVWRKITVIIDIDPPAERTVTIDTTGGTITVRWNGYSKWNFKSYSVVKACNAGGGEMVDCMTQTITNPLITSWKDTTYVGGLVYYRVQVTIAAGITGGGINIYYSWTPKTSFKIQNGNVTYRWQKSPFHKNISGVVLQLPDGSSHPVGISDSLFQAPIFKGTLGVDYFWKVTFMSKVAASNFQNSSDYYRGTLYSYAPAFPLDFNPKENIYYGFGNNGGYIAMSDSMTYIASAQLAPYQRAISGDGNYFLTYEPGTTSGGTFYDTDPRTLQVSSGKTLSYSISPGFQIANNGLLAVSANGNQVYAWPSMQLIYSNPTPTHGSLLKISPSGLYLLESNNVYHYDGSAFQKVGILSDVTFWAATFTSSDNLVLGDENGTITVFDSSTLSVLSTIKIPVTDLNALSFDPVSQRLLAGSYSPGNFVIDPLSGIYQQISEANTSLFDGKLFVRGFNYPAFYGIDYKQY